MSNVKLHIFFAFVLMALSTQSPAQQNGPSIESSTAIAAPSQSDGELWPATLRLEAAEDREVKTPPQPSAPHANMVTSTTAPSSRKVRVVAIGKDGSKHTVDEIDSHSDGDQSKILDHTGATVGYFTKKTVAVGKSQFVLGRLIVHFMGSAGPIQSTTELSCTKREGNPSIEFANARWHNLGRSIEFDLRSTCTMLRHSVGGSPQEELNISGLSYLTASNANDIEYRHWAARISIDYGAWGQTLSIRVDNEDVRRYRRCIADVRQGSSQRVCLSSIGDEYQIAWYSNGDLIEREFRCPGLNNSPTLHQPGEYFVGVCEGEYEGKGGRYADITLAQPKSNHLINVELECSCDTLKADRFHFEKERRVLSFNLRTEANEVKFEGQIVRLDAKPAQQDSTVVPIPLAKVAFNESWQVIGLVVSFNSPVDSPASASKER